MKYEITIRRLETEEYPEVEYTELKGEDAEKSEGKYAYLRTGRMLSREVNTEVYSQIVDDLKVGELAKFINK